MEMQAKLADRCCDKAPSVAARILEQHDEESAVAFLDARKPPLIAKILKESLPMTGARYLAAISPSLAGDVVRQMAFEDTARLLRHLDPVSLERVLGALGDDAPSFRKVLGYPSGTAGALMNPHVVVLPGDITISEAIRRVRTLNEENFYFPYVVDRDQRLIGILTVRGIMRNSPRRLVADVMQRNVVKVDAYGTGRELSMISSSVSSQSVPVTDVHGVLLGVLRPEAVTQLIAEVNALDLPQGYDTTIGSTLGGVFLDAMLRLTSVIMLAGAHPVEKQVAKGARHG